PGDGGACAGAVVGDGRRRPRVGARRHRLRSARRAAGGRRPDARRQLGSGRRLHAGASAQPLHLREPGGDSMKQVFSSCVPLVKAGDPVAINVTQSLDGRLTQDGPATVNVRIEGPQTSLLADMVAGVFPAPGSDQSPDEFLPHVALTRRTLPWERIGPDPAPTTPWLALLLFKESELRSAEQRKLAP